MKIRFLVEFIALMHHTEPHYSTHKGQSQAKLSITPHKKLKDKKVETDIYTKGRGTFPHPSRTTCPKGSNHTQRCERARLRLVTDTHASSTLALPTVAVVGWLATLHRSLPFSTRMYPSSPNDVPQLFLIVQ